MIGWTTGTTLAVLFGMPGHIELIIILAILLLLFGRRLPEVARSLGDGIREFKKGVREVTDDPPMQNQYQQPAQQIPTAPPAQPTNADERRVSQEPSGTAQAAADGGTNA